MRPEDNPQSGSSLEVRVGGGRERGRERKEREKKRSDDKVLCLPLANTCTELTINCQYTWAYLLFHENQVILLCVCVGYSLMSPFHLPVSPLQKNAKQKNPYTFVGFDVVLSNKKSVNPFQIIRTYHAFLNSNSNSFLSLRYRTGYLSTSLQFRSTFV